MMNETNRTIVKKLDKFKAHFNGDVFTDEKMRILYSTDASLYRKLPLAVVYPKTIKILKT